MKYRPTILPVAQPPYRPGEPEQKIWITKRAVRKIEPPPVVRSIDPATKRLLSERIPDPRYSVAFKIGKRIEHGKATADALRSAGLAVPI